MIALAESTPETRLRNARRSVVGAYIGTALEWYDFFLFGTTAAIVFGGLFFPSSSQFASQMGSFAALAVGFIARPLGAMIFGHYGDKFGRKGALIVTVIIMGSATTLIGVLPDFKTAGIVAPVLLVALRFVQGIAAGGEWGGATAMAVENAPKEKRGFYASMVQLGSPSGTLLSSGAIALVTLLPKSEFLSWGWRLPYLVSIVLVAVAIWIRWYLPETYEFRALEANRLTTKSPLKETFLKHPVKLMLGVGAYLYSTAGFGIISTFMISYVTLTLHLPASVILNATVAGAVAQGIVLLLSGKLADRIGAAKTVVIGYLVTLVLAFPTFWLVDTKDTGLITVAMVLTFGLGTIPYAPIGAMFRDYFPSNILYSTMALSANIAGIVAGFTPLIATGVLSLSNNLSWGPATLLLSISLISVVSAIAIMRSVKRNGPQGIDDGVSAAEALLS
ncbi:MFS transporter [Arthrobacter sp. MI7-26]|uniref:MFS transporter n=1 Tax=Arthrobacter sp. MI7-26 TaxID=2993653 RepID=UPI00224892DE|nr:MFS transporter [Arthrobacter sp. MI7-26]MCX2746849.1 MFS transporter [Arthrobacter sp. MI7-26]